MASRRELPLPGLARARMRGEVLDVRTDDLRFAAGEAERFLGERLGLALAPGEVAALDARTEGWPAALYLAALRLRLGDERRDVLDQLAGADLFGALTDELLRSSPEHERRFIVETSRARPLQRRAVRAAAGRRRAARSARSPAPRCCSCRSTAAHLVPLPSPAARRAPRAAHGRGARSGRGSCTAAPARWFESEGGEGELHEAMRHYLAAREWDLAAELLARHALAFVQSGALGGRAREWLAGFPPDVVRADARLSYVSALLAALDGDRAARDAWLAAARRRGLGRPDARRHRLARAGRRVPRPRCCASTTSAAPWPPPTRRSRRCPPAAPLRAAIHALTAWHEYLRGDLDAARTRHAARRERRAAPACLGGRCRSWPTCPARCSSLVAAERGDVDAAAAHADDAVAARDAGPLRGAPHTLPVTCAAARVQVITRAAGPGRGAAAWRGWSSRGAGATAR